MKAVAPLSAAVNFPCSKTAETSGLATSIRPAVAGIATKAADLMPRLMVFLRASKSPLAASAAITGKMAVASDMPSTPSGNWYILCE